jgi:hypothetical protein
VKSLHAQREKIIVSHSSNECSKYVKKSHKSIIKKGEMCQRMNWFFLKTIDQGQTIYSNVFNTISIWKTTNQQWNPPNHYYDAQKKRQEK